VIWASCSTPTFHSLTVTLSVPVKTSSTYKTFKEKWTPFQYGSIRHKKRGPGNRKPSNFVGRKKKHYWSERKAAPVKMIDTPVGRGVAARKNFAVDELVVEYGGILVETGLNLNTSKGVKLAGLDEGASYLLQLADDVTGERKQQWRLGGFKRDAEIGLLGSYANDPYGRVSPVTGEPLLANVKYDMKEGIPWLVCISPIKKDDEILVSYGWGPAVWKAHLEMERRKGVESFDEIYASRIVDPSKKATIDQQ
jgi:hypothetical protein